MSTNDAPDFVVNIYNPSFFASDSGTGLTQSQASALFLSKSSPDTATALTTFTAGIATNDIDTTSLSSNLAIGSSSNTGTLVIDTQGNTTIAASQVGGTLAIGGATTRTGAITIGSGGTGILPITIGSTAATATVNIRNPIMALSYTTAPTYTTANIGYTNTVILNSSASFGDAIVATAETSALSITSVPVGLWNISWGTVISSNSASVPPAVITTYYMFINVSAQSTAVPANYAGVGLQGQTVSVGPYTSSTIVNLSLSGSANVRITAAATVALRYYLVTSSGTLRFWNAGGTPVKPSTYLTITRLA